MSDVVVMMTTLPFSVVKHLKLLSQNPQMRTTSPAAEQMKQEEEEADMLWSRGSPRRTFNPDTEQEGRERKA